MNSTVFILRIIIVKFNMKKVGNFSAVGVECTPSSSNCKNHFKYECVKFEFNNLSISYKKRF